MQYNPDDAEGDCFPEMAYEAQIGDCQEIQSQAGNEMFKVIFIVYHGSLQKQVKEYIVNPGGLWKLKKLCEAIGFAAQFKAGTISAPDLVGKQLKVYLSTEEDHTGRFPDKNVVTNYMPMTPRRDPRLPAQQPARQAAHPAAQPTPPARQAVLPDFSQPSGSMLHTETRPDLTPPDSGIPF